MLKNQLIQHNNISGNLKMDTSRLQLPFKISIISVPRGKRYYKEGNWSQNQKLKFALFMDYNQHLFQQGLNKKSIKIFLVMSRFIKIRNPAQCRSHHQKALRHHKNTQNIIFNTINKVGIENYKKLYEIYKPQLQQINHSSYDVTYQQSCLRKKNEQNIIMDFIQPHSFMKSQKLVNGDTEKLVKYQFEENQYENNSLKKVNQKNQNLENTNDSLKSFIVKQPYIENQLFNFYSSLNSPYCQASLRNDILMLKLRKIEILNQCNYHLHCWMKSILELQNLKEQQMNKYFN